MLSLSAMARAEAVFEAAARELEDRWERLTDPEHQKLNLAVRFTLEFDALDLEQPLPHGASADPEQRPQRLR